MRRRRIGEFGFGHVDPERTNSDAVIADREQEFPAMLGVKIARPMMFSFADDQRVVRLTEEHFRQIVTEHERVRKGCRHLLSILSLPLEARGEYTEGPSFHSSAIGTSFLVAPEIDLSLSFGAWTCMPGLVGGWTPTDHRLKPIGDCIVHS